MAKFYGDIPCANLGGTVHITVSATELLCGGSWQYRAAWPDRLDRPKKHQNIIWREIDAVSCPICKERWESLAGDDTPQNFQIVR